ncbi:Exopolysaccharide biosynthesis protein YbjH [Loktanella fryxellensis]|uniref:Exopolysaccharide biosynthesis protein YbjH n=1 Tax=Loktanella fryxellensis TaxID=245187 RepID=A0A1H8H567_9RHOB|nr:YjbH domain-containing protein [Loktanella fryxellensis]SEN51150.1 Exopolysaccharide biosynthesis protein YbjH [Loktanella fryxellensis]
MRLRGTVSALTVLSLVCAPVAAQDAAPGLNTYAMPGLVEMPDAGSLARDDLAYSLSVFRNTIRHGVAYQLTDRLTFGLRYNLSYFPTSDGKAFGSEDNFDRSFGLHYRLLNEGTYRPALAVGINDLLGTGRFESEYLVATKSLPGGVTATAGLGWGRLASAGGFSNPLADVFSGLSDRDALGDNNTIGEFNSPQWFQGDAALFGGVAWQATDTLRLAVERSSDAYPLEDGRAFDVRSQYNFGAQYALSDRATLGAAWLYGSEAAVTFSYQINPNEPRNPSGLETAPPPVVVRSAVAADAARPAAADLPAIRAETAARLDEIGIVLHGLTVGDGVARVEIENREYQRSAQAVGRTARVLTAMLPAQVARFDIVLIADALPVSSTQISRADLETYQYAYDNAWAMQTRSARGDAVPGTDPLPGLYPRFTYALSPYVAPSFFDPDAPLRVSAGVALSAEWEPLAGLTFGGVVRKPLLGNLDDATRESTSVLPRVRSEAYLYDKADPALERLTGAYNFRPAPRVYARINAGLLESMFGGVAGEVLWYPSGSRFAMGVEVAHVVQRGFDQDFSFRDYEVTTGHVSGYWDMGAGYHSQLDVGRYLAGDTGATLTVKREFENGWSLGLFATLTDVPFDDFGEGSFDKGVMLTVPVGWVTGQSTRATSDFTLRPVQRDGGARLNLDGRLYDAVRAETAVELDDGWGRFWR